jgi:hypothetical protein
MTLGWSSLSTNKAESVTPSTSRTSVGEELQTSEEALYISRNFFGSSEGLKAGV